MRPFEYQRAADAAGAINAFQGNPDAKAATVLNPTQYLAGGTTLIDLMRLDVMRPQHVFDINSVERGRSGQIEMTKDGLWLGALVRMSKAADDAGVAQNFPVIAQSLNLAASAQIRNMASLGGNVLQRTRCPYFRDVSYQNCNKRLPGSGCAALEGINRRHAVLGTSQHCIAAYAGDFAHALIALDAKVEIHGKRGARTIAFAQLHKLPGETPQIETTLAPGEMIAGFTIPATPWARRSMYLKVRDRQSYEFALASAAVALNLEGGTVKEARIALGGVSAKPWRASEAEAALAGKALDDATLNAAADAAFRDAQTHEHNKFKVALGKQTLIRALRQTAALEL